MSERGGGISSRETTRIVDSDSLKQMTIVLYVGRLSPIQVEIKVEQRKGSATDSDSPLVTSYVHFRTDNFTLDLIAGQNDPEQDPDLKDGANQVNDVVLRRELRVLKQVRGDWTRYMAGRNLSDTIEATSSEDLKKIFSGSRSSS